MQDRSARNTDGDHERVNVSEFTAHFPIAQVIDDLPVDF
jgi:hypothetical protein